MPLPPKLKYRTLRLNPDAAGFVFQYKECVKKFLGVCTKIEMKRDTYDLNDPTVRKELIDTGFVGVVREGP